MSRDRHCLNCPSSYTNSEINVLDYDLSVRYEDDHREMRELLKADISDKQMKDLVIAS
jgi:hypothetical protein